MKRSLLIALLFLTSVGYSQKFKIKDEDRFKASPNFNIKKELDNYNFKRTLTSRSATAIDTYYFNYNSYSANWSGLNSALTWNETFTSNGNNYPRTLFLTNYVDTGNDGRASEATLIFDSVAWNGVSNNQYYQRVWNKDSVILNVDTFYLINSALFTDTTKLDGDSIVISFRNITGKALDMASPELKHIVFKNKTELMTFYNNGQYYTARIPVGISLPKGKGFGVHIKYYTDNNDYESFFGVAFGFIDSCKTIVVNGKTYSSYAHPPIFFSNNQHKEITASGATASEVQSGNNYYYNITGVPRSCSYVWEQAIDAGFLIRVESVLAGTMTQSPQKVRYCVGDKVVFSPNVSGGKGPYTYSWSATSGTIDNATDPAIELTLGSATSVTVTAKIKDNNNDSISISKTILVSNPTASISVTKTQLTSCTDSSVATASMTGATASTYTWSSGGSTTNKASFNTAGTYSVTITSTTGCTATASTPAITSTYTPVVLDFNYTPSSNICPNKPVSFSVSSPVSGSTYTWKEGSTVKGTGETIDITFTTGGTKSITLTGVDAAGCTATPKSKSVTVLSASDNACKTSISSIANDNIKIYPNPVREGKIYVESNLNKTLIVRVTDLLGKTITTEKLLPNRENQIDISSSPNGIYFVEVESGADRIVKKIVVDQK